MGMRRTIAVTVPADGHVRTRRIARWSVLSRSRTKLHWHRKLYHMLMGMFCFSLYGFILTRTEALWVLGSVGGCWILLDALRLKSKAVREAALSIFGPLMRREELHSFSANTFYILGLFIITMLFPKPVVLLSIIALAIGDPVAAIVGTTIGRIKILGNKSFEGCLANLVATTAAALVVGLLYFQLQPAGALLLALIVGISSTAAELLPLPVDDNLTIPIFSAILISGGLALFPLL